MKKLNVEQIYSEYFKTVYKYLICLTHNADIAEDFTQETFCKAISHINSFRGDCKISVWLCEIAKNLWLNELKKRKKFRTIDITEDKIDAIYSLEDEFLDKQEEMLILNQIKKLESPVREIFYLKLFSDLTFKEIGEIKGKTEIWARVNYYRGKKKIKEAVANERKL